MFTVLIVDDEEPVLESYAFILEKGVEGFRLAGKARTGYEAIALMHSLKPDIVFMDINMPGLDGIDTIAEVHDKFSDTVFVLSTAYERFDIAKRAIPLGVFAYLVKPVSKKLFIETLADIGNALSKRKTDKTAVLESGAEDRFMKEYLWRRGKESEWQSCKDALSLDSDRALVAFLDLDPEAGPGFAEINAALSLKYKFIFSMHLNLGMYFFSGDVDAPALSAFVQDCILRTLPSGALFLTGFGSLQEGVSLYLSCAEALDELNRKKNSTDVRLRERMRIIELRRKTGLSDYAELLSLFNAYWEEIFASYEFSLAKSKMITLFVLLIDDCTGCFQAYTDEFPPCSPAEEISALANLAEWKEWALSAFPLVYNTARQKRTGRFPVPLVKAIEFIEGNYTRQIQLSDAADAASVSAAYLSRLFGEHMDSSFIDYLTVMRVERAEKLIRANKLNIKEVSFAVGYQDPNYFSKIFRKIAGVSPSMYAQRSRYEKE